MQQQQISSAVKHIHFIGIGGTGMNGLAQVYLQLGYEVSGSDKSVSEATQRLQQLGAKVYFGHAPENINGANLVVYSSAIDPENPELVEAKKRNIPIWHRADLLADLMKTRQVIAVAGTHGKTTTSSMIFSMLLHAGLQPTAIIGGKVQEIGSSAMLGRGTWLVAETDESDKSFLRLTPKIAVVNNIEADHLEHYDGKFENIVTAFIQFMHLVPPDGFVLIGYDDPTARTLVEKSIRPVVTFGLHREADVRAENIRYVQFGSRFDLIYKNEKKAEVAIRMPGKHNVQNALAAIAVGIVLELDIAQILPGLEGFNGVGRRFEIKGVVNGITVVDDYAHNPSKVAAAIAACRTGDAKRVIAVFQPHRYTRTKFLAEQFGQSFTAADELIITEIYAAGETPLPGISSQTIIDAAKINGFERITYIPNRDEINDYLIKTVQPGDIVIYLGAGDIWRLADDLVARLKQKMQTRLSVDDPFPPIQGKVISQAIMKDYTTLKIGGKAELLVIPENIESLTQILHYAKHKGITPFILGAGSNILVRDNGIPGITIKLGEGFKHIEQVDTLLIRCGAAVMLPDLVKFSAAAELTGLEALVGIPGTVGGAIYMNAGAFNHSISECIATITIVDFEGNIKVLTKEEVTFDEHKTNLDKVIIVECLLKLLPGNKQEILAKMQQYTDRRAATQPLEYPSAGCFFRNPKGEGAGRWIDRAGLKGTRIGGAMISEKHANYIVNVGNATAQDCLELINLVQQKVKREFNIDLELEVKIVGAS
ncbi:MAG: UDP-N-acetylmuramate--L-alanine ligase [bacterium]|nr:UDP-N-acetylmuramate--L-alanine ligase [bacterium]